MHYSVQLKFNEVSYDKILNLLLDLGIHSFEEGETKEDEEGNLTLINENSLITIRCSNKEDCDLIRDQLEQIGSELQIEIKAHSDDYLNEWKKYSSPVQVTEQIRICPTWISEDRNSSQINILLDPGYAFGSGSHQTTRLCIQALEEVCTKSKSHTLLDVGCGSGILSIVASKLSFKDITGVDIDPYAIEAAKENALKNSVSNCTFSLGPLSKIDITYDVIVANILSSVLYQLKDDLQKKLKDEGTLILSGILSEEITEVASGFKFKNFEFKTCDEWAVIIGKY